MKKKVSCALMCMGLLSGVAAGCGDVVSQEAAVSQSASEPAQSVPEPAEEADEGAAHIEEYLEDARQLIHSWQGGTGKDTYYASDINADGFPEISIIKYMDVNAAVQHQQIYMIYVSGGTYKAECQVTAKASSNTSAEVAGGVIEFLYSSEGTSFMFHTLSASKDGNETSQGFVDDSFYVYKDFDILANGWRRRWDIPFTGEVVYQTSIAGRQSVYSDEEHFNHFSMDEYVNKVAFTEGCGWLDIDEALEHIGELPEDQ